MTKPDKKPAATCMIARIPNTKHGRAILAGVREFINTESYALRVEFSGPRIHRSDGSTRKRNATGFRLYLKNKDVHPMNRMMSAAWQRERELQQQINEYKVSSEHQSRLLHQASVTADLHRKQIADLRGMLEQAEEARDIAQGHAIDQEIQAAALRTDLEAIPAWLRCLCKRVRAVSSQLVQPDPRG